MKINQHKSQQGRMFTRELVTSISPFGKSNNLCPLSLYLFSCDTIPNVVCETNIIISDFLEAFKISYTDIITNTHYSKEPTQNTGLTVFNDVFLILKDSIMLHLDYFRKDITIFFTGEMTNTASEIYELIKKSKKEKDETIPKIHILMNGPSGLELEALELKKCTVSATDHYNDDFESVDRVIRKRLSTPKDKGMVLLHGVPGTGKTHYIKHLMTHVKKKVIFIPPDMADQLTNPSLISLFIEHPDSILVIEDAEKIIMDRDVNGNSPVSAILNLSDGILSDCLNMQIICSFNTDVSKIDKALMRKGRLIAKYEFGKLETSKANTLSRKLGFSTTFYEPQVLTDVFNQEEKQSVQQRKKTIGFH